jgi:hypothetical protein
MGMTDQSPDPLARIEAAALVLSPAAPAEALADVLGRLEQLKRRVREADALLKAQVLEWVTVNGPVTIGETRYWAGHRKVTTCPDQAAAVTALLAATGGDLDAVAGCLAADALKPGACRAALPPGEFDRLFRVEERPELRAGKPARRLMSCNTQFAGKGQANDE